MGENDKHNKKDVGLSQSVRGLQGNIPAQSNEFLQEELKVNSSKTWRVGVRDESALRQCWYAIYLEGWEGC